MTILCELAKKYRTDKLSKHNYTPIYFDMLKDRRESTKRVLEIGIGNEDYAAGGLAIGASLRMWEEFFPNAEIIGFDFDPKSMVNEGRILSVQCDQGSESSLKEAIAIVGEGTFDLIVDDGSHMPDHQMLTAQMLLPLLSPDGFYVIEDVYSAICVPIGYTSNI